MSPRALKACAAAEDQDRIDDLRARRFCGGEEFTASGSAPVI